MTNYVREKARVGGADALGAGFWVSRGLQLVLDVEARLDIAFGVCLKCKQTRNRGRVAD